ncbi:putative aliphatic sulfonates transport permease protein SsuC [compost metagenome]
MENNGKLLASNPQSQQTAIGIFKKRSLSKTIRGILLPLIVLLSWQLASMQGLISDQLFPAPLTILDEFFHLIRTGELFPHLKISFIRAALGFLIGGGAGLLLGILVGMFRKIEETVDPSVQMLRTIPLLAVTPLFILWFGFGELSKVLLISLGSFFPMYVNTFLGVRNVDAKLIEVSRVLEFSRLKQVTRLILPSALPNVLLGLRLSLSVAWLVLVVAELMGADEGIGYLIQDARSFMQTDVVFVGIGIFAAIGKLSDSIVKWFEDRLLRWRDSYRG